MNEWNSLTSQTASRKKRKAKKYTKRNEKIFTRQQTKEERQDKTIHNTQYKKWVLTEEINA